MSATTQDVAANLLRVRGRIEEAAARSGRRAEDITLIAVSKTHSPEKICELYAAGVRHFGENRVQEWEAKWPGLANLAATWHLIGHLQRNKAGTAAQLFQSIDSVDSVALAEKLDRAKAESAVAGRDPGNPGRRSTSAESPDKLRVLIEVKLDPEPAKSGVPPDAVARLAGSILRMPHLELGGLMGIPPFFDDPARTRPYFQGLRELRDATQKQLGMKILPVLSMGMSHDFEIAIEEGATEIRLGTALFGERETA